MFRKMPFILLAVIAAILVFDLFIPLLVKQILYSVSLSLKTLIVFFLPLIIFGLLFKSAVMLAQGATKMIGMILVLVCCSNFLSTFLSHSVGMWVYHFDLRMMPPPLFAGLAPLWTLSLSKLIANDTAMFGGIILGIAASKIFPVQALFIASYMESVIGKLLRGFVCFIPLFVAGFVMKLQYDGTMRVILQDYGTIFAVVALAQFSYIALAYFFVNNYRFSDFASAVRNMLPAAVSGFSTMSSAASLPLTLMGAERNARNKDVVRSVIPATVNIHLVGDCFAIPIFAYAVLKTFGMPQPDLLHYLLFAFYFVLAKFSVAAIPGGGIIVMLPILEGYLGFNAEMMSLITALYILFDPVITSANVFGNGAFAQMVDRITSSISALKDVSASK